MLRTTLEGPMRSPDGGDPENQVPGLDQPFTTEDRAHGVRFYRTKDGFFLPYHLLQGIQFTPTRITMRFQTDEVVIEGRGLHALYVGLAKQTVGRVVQQGERGRMATCCVLSIERTPRAEGRAAKSSD